MKTSNIDLENDVRILEDEFYALFPASQYQKYEAYESSASRHTNQTLRKSSTFYYNGSNISGFDKVLNGSSPEVDIQYIIEVKTLFNINL